MNEDNHKEEEPITRYDELCKAYTQNLNDFKNYKEECFQFALKFKEQLLEEFRIPNDKLKIRSKRDPKDFTDDLLDAMDMQKDTFWHVRFAVTVQAAEDQFPKENIGFEICIKKAKSKGFLLSLPREREFHIFPKDDKYDLHEFFEYLFSFLKGFYENELQRFLASGQTHKEYSPIGFRFDPVIR